MSKIPTHFQRAKVVGVLPADTETNEIGFVVKTEDGTDLRLRISLECSDFLRTGLANFRDGTMLVEMAKPPVAELLPPPRCTNCLHATAFMGEVFRHLPHQIIGYNCTHPMILSIIDGSALSCNSRRDEGLCGRAGAYFQPRTICSQPSDQSPDQSSTEAGGQQCLRA